MYKGAFRAMSPCRSRKKWGPIWELNAQRDKGICWFYLLTPVFPRRQNLLNSDKGSVEKDNQCSGSAARLEKNARHLGTKRPELIFLHAKGSVESLYQPSCSAAHSRAINGHTTRAQSAVRNRKNRQCYSNKDCRHDTKERACATIFLHVESGVESKFKPEGSAARQPTPSSKLHSLDSEPLKTQYERIRAIPLVGLAWKLLYNGNETSV
ncbi:hypothetical protein PHYBLDRAFT_153231 [Phycomyces blakesleeanus NRRL 1555(-)]|uniref:Uncharacterized protein n=1 Tax=Phycomyces blakesleeanus (strain ATCC 8743b / DSM 1359 / FGSC 10004 / NBRC 33097 / NRRL 1555) TaxID=763407 RepID=A0A162TBE9_PHYB8|nr:hypothetical protein PHYBLDRAFT_153231 [Phycomyces blakesleeanus NRRL 1555(-)]OAD65753.1 hypothetical protein PHYBLDRAFT_153231 [Phycomyces blakesleeanus NRRL 1555(-)]|eukprot:XP_018283793.1 hypothetical protein PHYBLDRAFT_153231 [Phycomyces blakesleeanus NRRL 1555(-)]